MLSSERFRDRLTGPNFHKIQKQLQRRGAKIVTCGRFGRVAKTPQMRDLFCKFFNDIFRGRVVLDVGCYLGYFSHLILDSAERVVGVDVDRKYIHTANLLRELLQTESRAAFHCTPIAGFIDDDVRRHGVDACFIHKSAGKMNEENTARLNAIVRSVEVVMTNQLFAFDNDTLKRFDVSEHTDFVSRWPKHWSTSMWLLRKR